MVRIRPVRLVEVDVVGAEPLEASLDGALDVVAIERGATGTHRGLEPAARRPRHLGGHHDRVAPPVGEPLPADLLARPRVAGIRGHGVDLGDVDEVDPRVEGLVEAGEARRLVGHAAEGHRAETQLGNHQARSAESSLLHGTVRQALALGREETASYQRARCF